MNKNILSTQSDKDIIAIFKQAIENKDFETLKKLVQKVAPSSKTTVVSLNDKKEIILVANAIATGRINVIYSFSTKDLSKLLDTLEGSPRLVEAILDVHFEAFEETLGSNIDSEPDFDAFEKYLQLYKNFAPPSFNLKIQDLIEAGLEELAEHYSLSEYDELYGLYNQHPSLKEVTCPA